MKRKIPTADLHRCEVERNGRRCQFLTFYQSMFVFNIAEKRFAWTCAKHSEEQLRAVEQIPIET
jgi:hypothetical protein